MDFEIPFSQQQLALRFEELYPQELVLINYIINNTGQPIIIAGSSILYLLNVSGKRETSDLDLVINMYINVEYIKEIIQSSAILKGLQITTQLTATSLQIDFPDGSVLEVLQGFQSNKTYEEFFSHTNLTVYSTELFEILRIWDLEMCIAYKLTNFRDKDQQDLLNIVSNNWFKKSIPQFNLWLLSNNLHQAHTNLNSLIK